MSIGLIDLALPCDWPSTRQITEAMDHKRACVKVSNVHVTCAVGARRHWSVTAITSQNMKMREGKLLQFPVGQVPPPLLGQGAAAISTFALI